VKTVPDRLAALADIYEDRNALYGDNYKRFGDIMVGLFPKGLTIDSAPGWNRIALLIHMVTKVTRYAENHNDGGHADSLDDIAVYSQMLREIDDASNQPQYDASIQPQFSGGGLPPGHGQKTFGATGNVFYDPREPKNDI
jgi:hypothetical protein